MSTVEILDIVLSIIPNNLRAKYQSFQLKVRDGTGDLCCVQLLSARGGTRNQLHLTVEPSHVVGYSTIPRSARLKWCGYVHREDGETTLHPALSENLYRNLTPERTTIQIYLFYNCATCDT